MGSRRSHAAGQPLQAGSNSVSILAIMTDRLDTIAIFVAVAEHQSFAQATPRLGRTPAAVTRAVAALEQGVSNYGDFG